MRTALDDALGELVDPCDGERGDWDEVLRRAGVTPAARGRLPRRRLSLVALAVVCLAIALFATPAFGLRDAVLGLIGREDVTFDEGAPAPEVVRKPFRDLDLGVPPGQDPQALPDEMRRVGTFRLGGRDRTLWVGPTRRGGFCYALEGASGGCLRDRRGPAPGAIAHTLGGRQRVGETFEVLSLTGWLFAPEARRLTVEFEDGQAEDVGFVYVSAPIGAGFFAYDVRGERRRAPKRPAALVLRDASDRVIARERIPQPRREVPAPRIVATRPQPLPAQPKPAPTEPRQVGGARGVEITAGANGAVLFDARAADELVSRFRGKGVSYVCFTLGSGRARGLGHWGAYAPTVGLRYFGLQTPFDGCEIQGSYGHRWPDRLGSHGAVEVAFTPAARRYYEDRAAARDLALFVRSGEVQRLRRLQGAELAGALAASYGDRIVRLARAGAAPPPGRIGYWPGPGRTVFRRLSTTGRTFEVVVADGRVLRHDLGELALVF